MGKTRFYMIAITFIYTVLAGSVWADAQVLKVYTVNYPLAYFAERIGGNEVEVVFPAPTDVDPAYWMPDADTISAYQQADLVLLNGANYAKWVAKVSLPRGKMVDTSRKFKDRYIYASEVTTHSHGAKGAHAHESLAFTTWLDFSLARLHAETIYKAFARKRPMREMQFKENYQSLAQELESLDVKIRKIVAQYPEHPLIASHPVYDYLSSGYGMNMKSVHWEPDATLTASQLNALNQILEKHPAKHMLWEGEPLADSVAKVSALGVASSTYSPCANIPADGDFMTVMQRNVEQLKLVYH